MELNFNLIFLQTTVTSDLCPILLSGRNLMSQPPEKPHNFPRVAAEF